MSTPVYPRPTLPNLIQRVTQQIQANLPGTDPNLRRSVSGIVATVLAQELMAEYAYLDFIATQFFVSTASGIYLDLRGNPLGVFREQPEPATGTVTFSGSNGRSVPAQSVLQSLDGTQLYAVSNSPTIASGSAIGTLTALTPGSASNQSAGATLTLSIGIAGINAQAIVAGGGLQGGTDLQSDDSYRQAVLTRMQLPPQGGASRDYVTWVKGAGVGATRVWVWPLNRGAGTVDWAFVIDTQAPGSILPNGPQIAAATANVLDNYPVDAVSSEFATLTLDSINVTLTNFVAAQGYTAAQAAANIESSLDSLFTSTTPGTAPYGDGIQAGSTGGTLLLESISDAITQSEGVGGFDLTSPSADIVSAAFHLAQFGTLAGVA
jgi:uncharacterized phage protein gp47/JayE